jgi:hypothetical protein
MYCPISFCVHLPFSQLQNVFGLILDPTILIESSDTYLGRLMRLPLLNLEGLINGSSLDTIAGLVGPVLPDPNGWAKLPLLLVRTTM